MVGVPQHVTKSLISGHDLSCLRRGSKYPLAPDRQQRRHDNWPYEEAHEAERSEPAEDANECRRNGSLAEPLTKVGQTK